MDTTAFFGRPGTKTFGLLSALVLFTSTGCGNSDRLKKQISSLETQVTAMRADQDRLEERLAALELSSAVPSRAAPQPTVERVERPRLKVIHVEPESSAAPSEPATDGAPADATSRRPVIRGTGDRVIKVFDGDSDESSRSETGVRPLARLTSESSKD